MEYDQLPATHPVHVAYAAYRIGIVGDGWADGGNLIAWWSCSCLECDQWPGAAWALYGCAGTNARFSISTNRFAAGSWWRRWHRAAVEQWSDVPATGAGAIWDAVPGYAYAPAWAHQSSAGTCLVARRSFSGNRWRR